MRVHYIQHISYEGVGEIASWVNDRKHEISCTQVFNDQPFPKNDSFDLLFVMGGPMGAYEERKYRWMSKEKRFIERALESGKPIVGICLGSQLLASVLGSRVYAGPEKQIGWWEVQLQPDAKLDSAFSCLPDRFTPLHWHGDTFELPAGATRLVSDAIYPQQAIRYKQAYGLQFHFEISKADLGKWVEYGAAEIARGGDFIQRPDDILCRDQELAQNKEMLYSFLDSLEAQLIGF